MMKKMPLNTPFDEIGEIEQKTITPVQRIEMNKNENKKFNTRLNYRSIRRT